MFPKLFPLLYLMHGGGPLPLTSDPSQSSLQLFLKTLSSSLPIPSAILLISAHWETKKVTILTKEKPELLFDYYGFPKSEYNYKYACPNDLKLIEKIREAFKNHGIEFAEDEKRGYDHGVFVPLLLMYPKAEIPVTQISLEKSLDPEKHIKIGRIFGIL
jgi:4,5-DOPA dioxygenase extradiol